MAQSIKYLPYKYNDKSLKPLCLYKSWLGMAEIYILRN